MEQTPRAEDKVNTYGIIVVGLVGALLTYVSVLALQAYYGASAAEERARKEAIGFGRTIQAVRSAQLAELSEARRLGGDRVSLPIDRAKSLVVADARQGARSLVPAVGAHDQPTVSPETGKPVGGAPEGQPADEGAAPAQGEGAPAAPQQDAPTGPPQPPQAVPGQDPGAPEAAGGDRPAQGAGQD